MLDRPRLWYCNKCGNPGARYVQQTGKSRGIGRCYLCGPNQPVVLKSDRIPQFSPGQFVASYAILGQWVRGEVIEDQGNRIHLAGFQRYVKGIGWYPAINNESMWFDAPPYDFEVADAPDTTASSDQH
jgi:hypothetical protein